MKLSNSLIYIFLWFSQSVFPAFPETPDTTNNMEIGYKLEMFGSVAHQSTTPFWMHNNTYGIVPLDANNGGIRGGVNGFYRLNPNLSLETGIDYLVRNTAGINYNRGKINTHFQQLYLSFHFHAFRLKIGSKEDYHSILDQTLSSGDYAFSVNARPIPEINLGIPEFTPVPFTHHYLQVKGDFAVGKFKDDGYVLSLVNAQSAYVQKRLLHHKSAYLKLKKPSENALFMILGFEDCAQWGGWHSQKGNQPQSLSDFWRIITGSEGDESATKSDQINVLGDHLGTYSFKAGMIHSGWEISAYKQHFFTDNSGMEYANWRDGIWGIECVFPLPYLKKWVFEYFNSTDQSGPFHFPFSIPHRTDVKVRYGGGDQYYNHGLYNTGWSYFGQAIGNPLIISPEYNESGGLGFNDTRIKAYHTGIKGNISQNLSYRLISSYIEDYGSHGKPHLKKKQGFSNLLECNYVYPKWKGWTFTVQLAADAGNMYANNLGYLLQIKKTGNFISKNGIYNKKSTNFAHQKL
jgi:hypothetical protein